MDQVDCQEVLRGPSVGVVLVLLRNCVSYATLSSAAGMISSLADVHTYLYMCVKFCASCLKETLLQTLKHSVWVTSNRMDNVYVVNSQLSIPGRLLQARRVYSAIVWWQPSPDMHCVSWVQGALKWKITLLRTALRNLTVTRVVKVNIWGHVGWHRHLF